MKTKTALEERREEYDTVRIAAGVLNQLADELLADVDASHVRNGQLFVPSGTFKHMQQYRDAVERLLDVLFVEDDEEAEQHEQA